MTGSARGSAAHAVAVAVLAGGLAAGLASASSHGARRERALASPVTGGVRLAGTSASFRVHPARGAVDVRSVDRLFARELELALVVDGHAHPLALRGPRGGDVTDVHLDGKDAVRLDVAVDVEGSPLSVGVRISVDRAHDALTLRAEVPRFATPTASRVHAVALRAELPTEGAGIFVSGVGEVSDLADVTGPMVVVAAEPHPLGFVSTRGPLAVHVTGEEHAAARAGAASLRAVVTSPPASDEARARDTGPARTDLRLVLGASASRVWRELYALAGADTSRVSGRVTGASERARVFGLDASGAPRVRAMTDDAGGFEIDAPQSVVSWYASVDPARASEPTPYTPGAPGPLVLDLSPGGELRVTVIDADTRAPLTARLIVHGIDGTLDPSFGPDYRASGAGPLIDALRGAVTTPLAPGRYRVSATKGIEWSIDAKEITLASAHRQDVALALRHVVATPGVVGCDLHVHARPSFDTPVTTEDRVLSLVAAGVEFAVPTEHNVVGDYGPSLELLSLGAELGWVHGVEVTTYTPRIGHFGVFPYPPGPVPPYRGTTIASILASARRGDADRIVQVNHPRMPAGIGYFEIKRFAPGSRQIPAGMRTDFDTIEVYNGYDLGAPDRVAAVMRDWFALLNRGIRIVGTGSSDAHRIQYHWAGYPRTFVTLPAGARDVAEAGRPLDALAIVAALKRGRAMVSTGPLVELAVGDARPGDEVVTSAPTVRAHVRVVAAPWVDVTSVDLVVGGQVVRTVPVTPRPTRVGDEPGTLAEAQARTLRFEGDIEIPIGPSLGGAPGEGDAWMCAVARGQRTLDDVLPFMQVAPLGFTNPVWIVRPAKNERARRN